MMGGVPASFQLGGAPMPATNQQHSAPIDFGGFQSYYPAQQPAVGGGVSYQVGGASMMMPTPNQQQQQQQSMGMFGNGPQLMTSSVPSFPANSVAAFGQFGQSGAAGAMSMPFGGSFGNIGNASFGQQPTAANSSMMGGLGQSQLMNDQFAGLSLGNQGAPAMATNNIWQ